MSSSIFHPPFSLAVVALGSNLGNSREIILAAMIHAQFISDALILKSFLWETTPVD